MMQSWANRENLNKNELWKLEKDGLEILNEIEPLAAGGFDAISDADKERLKWAGIYQQRPKNGKFLVRVKLASGELTSSQARVIAGIAKDYGQDAVQITIRQCIQVHNLSLEVLPDVLNRLHTAGLTSTEGCGDVPRNILGNPLMEIDPDELFDTTPVVHQAAETLVGNPEYSNLPRKYKISISANPRDCGFAGINDLAFVPAILRKKDQKADGFHVYVGGGLSTDPRLAKKLSFFILPEQAVLVMQAIAIIFREFGYREKRNHCRLKFLVDDWGTEKFEAVLEKTAQKLLNHEDVSRLADDLKDELNQPASPLFLRGGRTLWRKWNRGVFHGIHKQKQLGLYYAGFLIPEGAMTAGDLARFADLADQYGNGALRTTNSQNLLIINIPEANTKAVAHAELTAKYPIRPKAFSGYCAACTGNEYCSFAPIETKHLLQHVVEELDRRFPEIKDPFRVNLTGCAHACAHPMIADIGMTGARVRTDDGLQDAVTFQIAGNLGKNAKFGQKLDGKVLTENILPTVSKMIQYYLDHRQAKESFNAFVERTGTEPFQAVVDQMRA
ncbi:MAG: nitrite/sulfite reductase [Pseudoramibacter sp.]